MMNRGVMQRQMFVGGGVANAQEAKQRSLIINQIISIAERTNRPLDPDTVTYLQNLSTPDLIKFRDTVIRQNPYPTIIQEPRERSEIREKYGGPERQTGLPVPAPPTRKGVEEQRYDQFRFKKATPQPESGGRPTPDVYSGNVGDVMGEDYRGKETYLVPGQQMPKRPRYERDEYIIQGNIPNPYFEQGMESDLRYLSEMRRRQALDMARGGEAVPNQYKGFSKLPENVQQKMNPALAKRYQQGGIASMMDHASMPQGNPMAGGQMDPAQMAMMEAEQAGRAQGEQIGAMVGEQTMMGLDQADDFKGAIDAIRGNNAPLEARYQELSEYVGPQDAMQTPESVLAMVQPTIMMTEEGAVDSGIGQLMQQITGNTAMETPDGQPTAMAEGVGSLMGVGQPPAEKKLLADGGAVSLVPAYQSAGEVSYDDILKRFQAVSGDPQARKDALQSDILFSLADRGLALAGGVDPRTGESMAGAPFLSQLGRAGAGLGATIGERLASNRALDQQLRTAALTETLSQEKEGRARLDAFKLAELKAVSDLEKQKIINAGKLSEIDLKSKLDLQSKITIEQLQQTGRIDLAKFNLRGDESLEKLKQLGALTLEEYKQANRTALEGTLQQNREALETLRQSGKTTDMILADKLEKENIQIRADLELNKLGVANEYEIDIIDRKHDQAVEINTTNNALQEKLANVTNRLKERDVQVRENAEARQLVNDSLNRLLEERRVKVSEFNAQISAAQGQEKIDLTKARDAFNQTSTLSEQDLNERKLLLEKDKLALDKFEGEEKVRLEEEKLALEAAASKFNKYGKALGATTIAIVSNPDLLQKYGNNTLTEEDGITASEMSAFLTKYNQPTMDWSEEKKAFVRKEGLALTDEMLDAIKLRKENGLSFPKLKGVSETPKIEVSSIDNFTSGIMDGVENPALAFGSPAAFKSFANVFFESVSLGFLDSVAPEAKEAIKSIDNLNVKFLNEMQKAADLRDSVAQLDLFKSLIPQTSKLFVGKGDAISSTKAIVKRIEEEIQANNMYLESKDLALDRKKYSEIQISNMKLKQLRAGYKAIVKANDFVKKFDDEAIDKASDVLFGGQ